MPDNGSGTFTVYVPGNPVVTGTTISSTVFNATTNDIATAMTNRIARDGQSPPTANTPWGSFRITGLGDPSGTQDAATKNYADTTQPVTAKNKIVNGGFRIDQRNNYGIQNIIAAAALVYTCDKWYAYCSGANVTATCASSAYAFFGAASVTGIFFGQRIEGLECQDLVGQACTLSFTTSNTFLGTMTWAIYYATSLNAFGTRASPTRTLISTGSVVANGTFNVSFTPPAGAQNGIEVVFSVGAQTSGTWSMFNVQVVSGSVTSAFQNLPLAIDILRCQRFYEIGTYLETLPLSNASIVASYLSPVNFKVTKFASPTVTGANDQGVFSATATTAGIGIGRSDTVANRNNSGTYIAVCEIP